MSNLQSLRHLLDDEEKTPRAPRKYFQQPKKSVLTSSRDDRLAKHEQLISQRRLNSIVLGETEKPEPGQPQAQLLFNETLRQFTFIFQTSRQKGAWSLLECEIRQQKAGHNALVIGERHAGDKFYPRGHAILRGDKLMFYVKEVPYFALTVDPLAPCLKPIAFVLKERPERPPNRQERRSELQRSPTGPNPSNIFMAPALNKLRIPVPFNEPNQPEPDEVEDGLTAEDLARLRGDAPIRQQRHERQRG